jgi:hypothetical protein
MPVEQFNFPPNEDDPEKVDGAENQSGKGPEMSPEGKPEKVSGAEALLGTLILGMKVKRFFDSKGAEMGRVFDEAATDFKSQPTALREIIGNSVASFGSLVMEHQREQKEKKLQIKQKLLNSLQKMAAQRDQLDMLDDYERLQEEEIVSASQSGAERERAGIGEKERGDYKSSVDSAQKKKKDGARAQVGSFVSGLMSLLG